MSRTTDPFFTAKLAVMSGKRHLDDFKKKMGEFLSTDNIKTSSFIDRRSMEYVQCIDIVNPIPDELELSATQAIGQLRSALDKAVSAGSRQSGIDPNLLRYSPFPFAVDKNQLVTKLASGKGNWRGIAPQLHEYLISLQPYKGGNDVLYAFGRRSNPVKHEDVLTIDASTNLVSPCSGPNGDTFTVNFSRVGTVWNKERTRAEIFRVKHSHNMDFEAYFSVILNDAGILTGKDSIEAISEIVAIVNDIISGIEARVVS